MFINIIVKIMEDNNLLKSYSNIPSSTPEVKIRTMKSDIESFNENGGGSPQFMKVKVSGLSVEAPVQGDQPQFSQQSSVQKSNNTSALDGEKKTNNSFNLFIMPIKLLPQKRLQRSD